MRFRITIELNRAPKPIEQEPEFEHRDNDTLVEATGGGDPRAHRMGFNPPVQDDRGYMQAAKVQRRPEVRPSGHQIQPPKEST